MKGRHIFGHLLFWVVVILTYSFSEWGYSNNLKEAVTLEFIFLPPRLIAVYLNWFVIIPVYLYKKQVTKYILILFSTLGILALIQVHFTLFWAYPYYFPHWDLDVSQPYNSKRIVQNVVIISQPVALSIGIKILFDWYKQKTLTNQLKIEKREAELKYLKGQINPHFLFNTLNNLYGSSMEKSPGVPNLILKLSDILSYSLYGSTAEKVAVREEIKIIRDYVDLECDRYEDKVSVYWNIDKKLLDIEIAPLLYIPLVENAFKHGVHEKIGHVDLVIQLIQENNQLLFKVENTYVPLFQKQNLSGIGLKNLQKRLKLLYPGRSMLKTYQEGDRYISLIKLSLT